MKASVIAFFSRKSLKSVRRGAIDLRSGSRIVITTPLEGIPMRSTRAGWLKASPGNLLAPCGFYIRLEAMNADLWDVEQMAFWERSI
jgi:hypothetical protein